MLRGNNMTLPIINASLVTRHCQSILFRMADKASAGGNRLWAVPAGKSIRCRSCRNFGVFVHGLHLVVAGGWPRSVCIHGEPINAIRLSYSQHGEEWHV